MFIKHPTFDKTIFSVKGVFAWLGLYLEAICNYVVVSVTSQSVREKKKEKKKKHFKQINNFITRLTKILYFDQIYIILIFVIIFLLVTDGLCINGFFRATYRSFHSYTCRWQQVTVLWVFIESFSQPICSKKADSFRNESLNRSLNRFV